MYLLDDIKARGKFESIFPNGWKKFEALIIKDVVKVMSSHKLGFKEVYSQNTIPVWWEKSFLANRIVTFREELMGNMNFYLNAEVVITEEEEEKEKELVRFIQGYNNYFKHNPEATILKANEDITLQEIYNNVFKVIEKDIIKSEAKKFIEYDTELFTNYLEYSRKKKDGVKF